MIESKKILMTGGSGLLGREILRLDPGLLAPSSSELDVTSLASVERALDALEPAVVLHLAAATNPPEHETHPEIGLGVNILGTTNIALACLKRRIRLVYSSTDYVYAGPGPHKENEAINPSYNFGWSKAGGECAVRLCPNSLILRLSFGPVPFPWQQVYKDQLNSKLYVDEVAPLVLAAAKSQGSVGIMNIGGPQTTLEAYAKRTRPDIGLLPKPAWVPADTSLDITLMKGELGISDEQSLLKH